MNRYDELLGGFAHLSMGTSEISFISHAHGRERRSQRGIIKKELQAAIKNGKKERVANGRNGDGRWKFTHNGVV